jgi:hypothetical protein
MSMSGQGAAHAPEVHARAISNLRQAVGAIGLLTVVASVNIAFYILIILATRYELVDKSSIFPPLVMFLTFSISIGIILLVALGEKIQEKNIENSWIKRIGVTPTMVIVATILSIAAGFSGISDKLFPPATKLKFMLADIKLTCTTNGKLDPPPATQILAVISSTKPQYIKDVKDYLNKISAAEEQRTHSVHWLAQQNDDKIYKLLQQTAASDGELRAEIAIDDKWTAYLVDLKNRASGTLVPMPTMYDVNHTTRLFLVVSEPPKSKTDAEAASVTASLTPVSAQKALVPLVQAQIAPEQPRDEAQLTNVDLEVFGDPCLLAVSKG